MKIIDAEYALATSISGLIRIIEGEPWIRVKEVRDSLKNVPPFDIDNIITEHENIGYEKGFRDGYAEAVDTKPVRHGHWINDKGLYKCSVCNEFATIAGFANCIPIEQMNKTMKYCNNCGAKMDEVNDG